MSGHIIDMVNRIRQNKIPQRKKFQGDNRSMLYIEPSEVNYDFAHPTPDELQKINRYYISNKGCKIVKINKNDQREIQLESGQWVQTVMNKIEDKKWSDYDINEKYYLNAIEKEINNIIGVKNNQLMLFE